MAVLLSYHKLVERDAKHVDIYWKASSIILLVLAIICSVGVSLSLEKLIESYDDRCILHADVHFETELERANYFQKFSNSMRRAVDVIEDNSVKAEKSLGKLSDHFNESYASFLNSDLNAEYPVDQIRFLVENEINDRDTVWGPKSSCDFGVYIPICQTCFGIIMATMFVICGKGGKSAPHSFLPQPWRIVTPALVFFLIMTILSIVNLVIVQRGMDKFCESFERVVPDIGCDVGMNRFMIASIDDVKLSPSILHKMLTSFNYVAFSFWLLSLLVLLVRIMFVIDFQLVQVTVKTIEYENVQETTKLQAVEDEPEPGTDSTATTSV